MRKALLPAAVVAMAAIIACAFLLDCVRLTLQVHERVEAADAEVLAQEHRLARILSGWTQAPQEVSAALDRHATAESMRERRAAYESLTAAVERAMQSVGASQQIKDEIAGAVNRRSTADRQFQIESAEYDHWKNSYRGRCGVWFLSSANTP